MCPAPIDDADPVMIGSCGTLVLRTHIKQYENGKLYQKILLAR